MKNTAISFLLALVAFLGLQIASPAAPIATLRWEVAPGAPRPASFRLAHGASALLEAHFLDNRSPIALPEGCAASLHFRTNGMSGWWPAPHGVTGAQVETNGIVRARWAAALDSGADEYQLFLRVSTPDGGDVDYSAFAALTMLESPGFVPNALPLPVQNIDFAAIKVTNAPWATPEGVDAAIAEALADYEPGGGITEETDPVFGDWARTNGLSRAVADLQGWQAGNTYAETSYVDDGDADTLAAARKHTVTFTTNYYALSALGRIYVTTNDYLYVEKRDTTTNAWQSAWSSYAMQTNAAAVAARQTAVERTVARAVSAWADFDAQGHANPDADIITLNRAYTAIGSGFFWASSGGYYCLCSEGTVAYLATTNGSFRIFGNSISNYVGLIAGGTVTVGANAAAFRVLNGVASITYPWSGGDLPTIYGAATLAGPWTEMSSATWITDANAGTATASFPANQTAFFFKATTTRQLSEYFHTTVPAYLEGGVKTSDDDLSPIVYDSKITITSGGHTYRIPAELVQ